MLKYDIYSDYGNSGSPIYFIDWNGNKIPKH
jgi:hypothetical protein